MRAPFPVGGAVLLLAILSCGSQPEADAGETAGTTEMAGMTASSGQRTVDPQEIRALVDTLLTAWNGADTATLAALVAEDVVLLQPDGPVLEGRSDILDMIAGAYDVSVMQQSATVDEVAALGDHAYARGGWTVAPRDGGESFHGKWSTLYRRGPDGGWRMWRWMWNQPSDQAVPPAP